MRKILIALLIVIVLATLWLWRGRDLSMLADQFKTIQTSSRSIRTITYDGNGTGGTLRVDDVDLSLNQGELRDAQPSVGTTKDGQVALSFAGKVFSFGPPLSEDDKLAANVVDGDTATIAFEHSAIPWRNYFEVNYMTGNSPKWKRNTYQKLVWKRADGAKLEMVWRYEQFFYENDGWTQALMTRPGAAGLIRVEISNPSR
jgi:hypothetical protein